jgi:hypothetical protein
MSYEDNDLDETSVAVDFDGFKNKILCPNEPCWGCDVGLTNLNPEEKVQQIYETFRKGRTSMTQRKLFSHIYQQKIRLYPDDPKPFPMEQIYRHFNYHIKDYFTELTKQSEDLTAHIEAFNTAILRTNQNDPAFKIISQNYKNLLDAMRFQQITLEKIENYREKDKSSNITKIGS